MTLVPSTAASAVYHDALTTARKFRTLCVLVLLLVLLGQLALFFAAKYWEGFPGRDGSTSGQVEVTTGIDIDTQPEVEIEADGEVDRGTDLDLDTTTTTVSESALAGWGYMAVYLSVWLGLVFSILLALSLVFITLVMLNGRTVGVTRVSKAFLWSLLLLMLMVPWQAVLTHPEILGGAFHIPGVLWTWPDLMRNIPDFEPGRADWLGWLRFVAWPVVALILLLLVAGGSGRGIKQALGEDLVDVEDEPVNRPVS